MVSITRPDDEPEHVAHWNGGYPLDGIEVADPPTTARSSSAAST